MGVVAAVAIEAHVVAAVIRLERVVLGPGQIVVVEVDVYAVLHNVIDRRAEVVDRRRIAESCDAVVADDVALPVDVDAGVAGTHVGLGRSRVPRGVDADDLVIGDVPVSRIGAAGVDAVDYVVDFASADDKAVGAAGLCGVDRHVGAAEGQPLEMQVMRAVERYDSRSAVDAFAFQDGFAVGGSAENDRLFGCAGFIQIERSLIDARAQEDHIAGPGLFVGGHETVGRSSLYRSTLLKRLRHRPRRNGDEPGFCRCAAVGIGHGKSHFVRRLRFKEQHAAGEQIARAPGPVFLVGNLVMNAKHRQGVFPLFLPLLPECYSDRGVAIAVAFDIPAKA